LDDVQAATTTADAPVASAAKASVLHSHTSAAHAGKHVVPATKKAVTHKATPQASAGGTYRLSHQSHQLDSYQKAVTPSPVTTDR
jgi:hypothetical protein